MADQDLVALRERIRTICIHDQAQWNKTWKDVFDINQRGLILPSMVLEVLKINGVVLTRLETRLLMQQFQELNGTVATKRFLHWIGLTPPSDYLNQAAMFALPIHSVKKILDRDIIDAAWKIITTDRAQFNDLRSSLHGSFLPQRGGTQTNNDNIRSCVPTWQISLENTEQVVALASHYSLPIVLVVIKRDGAEDSIANVLRVVNTLTKDMKIMCDFPVVYPDESLTSAESITRKNVLIKTVSSLQLAKNSMCCLAVHLMETSNCDFIDEGDPDSGTKSSAPTTRECVNIYTMSIGASDEDSAPCEFSCTLVTVIILTNTLEAPVSTIVLSPDSEYLAVTYVGSPMIALYRTDSSGTTEPAVLPLILSLPTFQIDLEPTRSIYMEDKCEPTLYFLVTPATTQVRHRAAPSTYALAVCYGLKVLKYVLPIVATASVSSPLVLTPTRSWEHLTKITASVQDTTTQYVVVGCQDGTIVVWDVLQDVDYVFLSPAAIPRDKMKPSSSSLKASSEINSIFFHAGYVVAQSQQHLFFYDVQDRAKPLLVSSSLTSSSITGSVNETTFTSYKISMMRLVATVAAFGDYPIALVEDSNGMINMYDVRTAELTGCIWTMPLTALPSTSHLVSPNDHIVSNSKVLAIVTDSTRTLVNLYSWNDILLVCLPSCASALEKRQQDLLSPSASSVIASSLESIFLNLAGRTSPSVTQQSKPIVTPSVQSLGDNRTLSFTSCFSTSSSKATDLSASNFDTMLQPLVLDDLAFFEQYCRENLNPRVTEDKALKLHKKRQELLRTMSSGDFIDKDAKVKI